MSNEKIKSSNNIQKAVQSKVKNCADTCREIDSKLNSSSKIKGK